METRWLYRTAEDFNELRKASNDTCLIPMGCVEKHGLHLPLGTDIIHSSHIAHVASQMETVCVFPDFTFGDVPEAFPNTMPAGSITLPVETEMLLLEQLCEQIARHGYRKILIYNGHGGNQVWLQTFMRKMDSIRTDFIISYVMMDLPVPHKMAQFIEANGSGSIPELTKEDEELIIKYHKQGMLIYENAIAQELVAHGVEPYYYNNKKRGELDFIIELGGRILPIEVKSGKDYEIHRALSNIMDCSEYNLQEAVILNNDNLRVEGKLVYAPVYMVMFLERKNDAPTFYKVDLSGLV